MTIVPDQMRAAFLDRAHSIAIRQIPVPHPRPGDVLVKVVAVGICGSDVHFFEHGQIGDLVVIEPLILGHETSGLIVAVGEGIDEGRIGQRVAVDPQRPCRRCEFCRSGTYNLCVSMEFGSAPPVDGSFAEYVTAPSDFAFVIPDSLSFAAATLLEPLSVGIAGARKARVTVGSRVLIAGAGPIGVLTAAACRAFGASEVIVSDPQQQRHSFALAGGATRVIDPRVHAPGDRVVDSFIDASGAPAAIEMGLRALVPGGHAVFVGMAGSRLHVDLFLVQSRELHLHGLFRYVDTWPAAIAISQSGVVNLETLVSEIVGFDDLASAMERSGDPELLKIVVTPHAQSSAGYFVGVMRGDASTSAPSIARLRVPPISR